MNVYVPAGHHNTLVCCLVHTIALLITNHVATGVVSVTTNEAILGTHDTTVILQVEMNDNITNHDGFVTTISKFSVTTWFVL